MRRTLMVCSIPGRHTSSEEARKGVRLGGVFIRTSREYSDRTVVSILDNQSGLAVMSNYHFNILIALVIDEWHASKAAV